MKKTSLFVRTAVLAGLMLSALFITACPNKPAEKKTDDEGFIKQMKPEELGSLINNPAEMEKYLHVDVRRDNEYYVTETAPLNKHFRYAIHIHLVDSEKKLFIGTPEKLKEIEDMKDKDIIVTCRTNKRSQIAAKGLQKVGFKKIFWAEGVESNKYTYKPEVFTQVPNIRKNKIKDVSAGGTVLDARSAEEFGKGHFDGAVNVPSNTDIDDKIKNLDKSKPVVIYAASAKDSLEIAEKFFKAGFKKTYNCIEKAWK